MEERGTTTWLVVLMLVAMVTSEDSSKAGRRIRRQVNGECDRADIIFSLDSSGSIGSDNWIKVLNFTNSVINNFAVGENNVRVGVNSYGTKADVAFHLNEYYDKGLMMDAVSRIKWKEENTNTSGGIKLMYRDMFVPLSGDRPSVANIGIVITDGKSTTDKHLTIPEAANAKAKNIILFAIGVGDEVDEEELLAIASSPDVYFPVADFSALEAIRDQVVRAACDVPSINCSAVDLVVLLDGSGSVSETHFEYVRNFTHRIIETAIAERSAIRVGAALYSTSTSVQWHLNTPLSSLLTKLDEIVYEGGTTNTADALGVARDVMFTAANGDRMDVPNVIVLLTDGGANDFLATLEQARETRLVGITILVVGVTNWVNWVEINEVASDPDNQTVFHVNDFAAIDDIYGSLIAAVCDGNECNSNPCRNGGTCVNLIKNFICTCPSGYAGHSCEIPCPNQADISILLDASGSVKEADYYGLQGYVKHLVRGLNPVDHRVALQTYANETKIRFALNRYSKKSDLYNAISFPYIGGETDTAAALRAMRTEMFTSGNGDRVGVRNVGLLFSDGESKERDVTFREAVLAHEAGITMLGFGCNVNGDQSRSEMKGICSDPDESNYLEINSMDELYAATSTLIQNICNDVNECLSNPCQAGGTCVDRINGYECRCPNGRSGPNCERSCDGALDLIFVLDVSGSIHEDRFHGIVIPFIQNITERFEVRPTRTHVAALTFADMAEFEFDFRRYREKEDVIHALGSIPYRRGQTHTADGLRMLRDEACTTARGDRPNAPNLAFVITDGHSNVDSHSTLPEAVKTREAGIHIIVVAVENDPDSLEMKGIASRPSDRNIMSAASYNLMPDLLEDVIRATCDDRNECSPNPCQNGGACFDGLGQAICNCQSQYTEQYCTRVCTKMNDVIFMLDASGSLDYDYEMAQHLAIRITMGLNFQGSRTRVGVFTYQDTTMQDIRFHLNTYSSLMEVTNAIGFDNDVYVLGTDTATAFVRVRDMFSTTNGDRDGVDNTLVVITDGRSNQNAENTIVRADEVRSQGVRVIAVGTGSDVNHSEINGIANSPASENAFYIPNGTQMDAVADRILNQLCNS